MGENFASRCLSEKFILVIPNGNIPDIRPVEFSLVSSEISLGKISRLSEWIGEMTSDQIGDKKASRQ